ncbi:MAG TPA: hypothetical protein DCP68_04945 [Ruminococcus sp.]|nr:hypothetical protein [Ruminococcus sp.]
MKKTLFIKLLTAMGLTLALCVLIYPLLMPTENYFRLVLQLIPMSIITGLLLIAPLYFISGRMAHSIGQKLKRLRIDSKSVIEQYPELKPLARQVTSLKAQIDTQMNELTGQQEQLKVLTDNMQEGLLLVSAAGRVLSYNRAALQLLGKEGLTDDYFPVYDLSESKIFRRLVRQTLNGIRGSATLTVGDHAVQIIANPVIRDSRLTGAVLVLLDVSEREKRDALRREFTSNVSHELKTPLTSIYGIADMMESGMVKKKDIGGFARRIRDESARMITLIEDIIRLSRLDDESFTEEILPLDLYEVANTVLEQLRAAADARGITMELEGDSAPMQGVPVIVEEMLFNLCDNAIKYNNDNGSVKMKVTCTDQQAIFSVSDTGIGIPQADQKRIFERFYRVDKSHSKQIGGTGLGLSIVKHGAQFHSASIELESQPGSGTTITLFFPRSAEAAARAESDAKFDPLNVEIPGESKAAMIQIRDAAEEPAEDAADTEAVTEAEIITETEPAEEPPFIEEVDFEDEDESAEDEVIAEDAEDFADDEEIADDAEDFADDEEIAEDAEDFADDEEIAEDTEDFTDDEEIAEDAEDFADDEEIADVAEDFADDEVIDEDTEVFADDEVIDEDTEEFANDEGIEEDTEDFADDAEFAQDDIFSETDTLTDGSAPAAERRLPLDETDRLLNEAAAALDLELFTSDAPAEPEITEAAEPAYDEPAEPEPLTEPEPAPAPPKKKRKRIDVVPISEDNMDIRI